MRAVVQRVSSASVEIEGEMVAAIQKGSLILLGIEQGDTLKDAEYLCDKIINLRIFQDQDGKMNLSVKDISGSILLVSQFTLAGDCRKGRRPNFSNAMHPDGAIPLYEEFIRLLKEAQVTVETGLFGGEMQINLINDGPVTLMLCSRRTF